MKVRISDFSFGYSIAASANGGFLESRMRHGKLLLLFLAVVLASPAATIFSENFEGATPGFNNATGAIAGTQFTLTSGSIDVNGPGNGSSISGFYQELCVAPTSGNCIDTTGGNPAGRGTISTTIPISFNTPGSYALSFDLAGWYEPGFTDVHATVQVDLGSLIVHDQFTANGASNPYAVVTIPFQVTAPTAATLTFTDLSGNYTFAGAILDNVSISSTPEPGSVLLFGAGALLILLARMRIRL